MFAKLTGIIDSIHEGTVVLDVNGVGYLVHVSDAVRANLEEGRPASLIIETQVREDHISLFGFATRVEKEWFNVLLSVQRVGAKMALSILSAMPPEHIQRAIIAKDTNAFSRISGIGGKLAERIVVELKDKALRHLALHSRP